MIFQEWHPLAQVVVWVGGITFLTLAGLSVIQVICDGINAIRPALARFVAAVRLRFGGAR